IARHWDIQAFSTRRSSDLVTAERTDAGDVNAVMARRDLRQEFTGELAPAVGHVRLAHFLEIDVAFLQLQRVRFGLQIDRIGRAADRKSTRLNSSHVKIPYA